MKIWIKTLFVFLFFSLIFLPKNIEAHSGRTDSSGCHNCYTSECYGEYHCHNGGSGGYQAPPSCPSMSSYNSLSGQCECYSGYIASGNSCISVDQACKNKYGYNSERDYSSDGCKCRYGYVWNSSKTACISEYEARPSCPSMAIYNSINKQCECMSGYVASGNSCISVDQSCKNKYGYNSKATLSGDKCECKYGYIWNSTGTKCIDDDQACRDKYGYNSKATLSGDKCECNYGYTWNQAVTKCITKDAACQELNGLMSRSSLSGECECLSGYEYDGSECVYIVKKNIITPKPTISKQEPTKVLTPTPTTISSDISSMPDLESSLTKLDSGIKINPISNFFSRLFSWFFN